MISFGRVKAKGQSEAFGGTEKSLREKEKRHRKHSTVPVSEGRGGGVPVKEEGQNKQSQGGQAKGGRGMPDRSLGGKKIKDTIRQPTAQLLATRSTVV